MSTQEITYFRAPANFRKWLEKNHATRKELWVGFYKKDSGKPSITWPESVDQALSFGWIDGLRKRVDEESYTIRFTPRRRGSIWSAINIKRVEELTAQGLMHQAGLDAFALRREYRSGIYSYEQRTATIPEPYLGQLKKNKAAFKFFESQTPGYHKLMAWWIVSAKKEETRLARLRKLIASSVAGQRIQ